MIVDEKAILQGLGKNRTFCSSKPRSWALVIWKKTTAFAPKPRFVRRKPGLYQLADHEMSLREAIVLVQDVAKNQ